ncbi:hypothetical protein BCR36DRAFT_356839 [Piromyces finnis]|uniref:GPI-anchor transamidase n=1 Tax=Piromyces finnis TaxID=1754191 RepID=A0A1Y1V407_9FUNG|nr:hypothetical protein BCR36DRAFT_356839 [Piromyces finnis]|eukprot:ORX46702.1 hypothetical protein BCR36DRAFT_356839 [Piromyces finnis]
MRIFQTHIYIISIIFFFINVCRSEYSSEFHFPNEREEIIDGFFSKSRHTNNWAVLVDTSRYWFNYRHIANVLSIYRTVKRLGIPDSNIILMLADDVACNPRNRFQATVYNNAERKLDLYGDNIEVDYRGYEVTVENFIRLLTGRHLPDTPRSKRLLSDDRSNVLVYMTGHGGEEFLKFQDTEEISSYDIADAFEQMWEKRRYNELLFMIDTCQASSMFSRVYSPNILATGSSQTGQNSYSHHLDPELGVAVIDRYTYYNLETLEYVTLQSQKTLQYLFNTYDVSLIHSTPGVRHDLFERNLNKVLITDFFGAVNNIELTLKGYKLSRGSENDIPDIKQNTIRDKSDEKIEKINHNNDDHLIPRNEYKMIKVDFKKSAMVSPLFLLGSIALISGIIFISKIVN